jgi:hypothetical protein
MQADVIAASEAIQKQQVDLASVDPQDVTRFAVGDYVLVQPAHNPLLRRRRAGDKLNLYWLGPYKVKKVLADNQYKLYDEIQNKAFDRHIKDLKPYHVDPSGFVIPKHVAMIDNREHVIEKIFDYEGNPKKKTELSFLVHFLGDDPDEDVWLKYSDLRNSAPLLAYMRSKEELNKTLPKNERAVFPKKKKT